MQLYEPVPSSGESGARTVMCTEQGAACSKRLDIEREGRVLIPPARPASRFARRCNRRPGAIEHEDRAETTSDRSPSRFARRWERSASRFAGRDLDELGRVFARIVNRGGLAHWIWGQALLVSYEANPVPLPEAGRRVGLGARGRAYSKEWMSRVLLAAREWPRRPTRPGEWAGFTARLHAHDPKVAGEGVPVAVRIQRLLRQLRRAMIEALRLGCTAQDVRQWLDAELLSALDGQKTAPAPADGEMRVKA